ncbi:MAG: pilus assembly protein TadG-related protein, partial [Candidatus Brocadiia bacterium]|nr:pilus assembly protein TadG-related protein [Candidatus Brocadiia bacterium]
ILERLAALRRDESGQSLVFGVISVFLLLLFGAMVLGVGRVSARRIQMQFAADSAAYSSALVESECLNAIALLNTGMAQVRGRALRYVADVNAYGVLAELRDRVMNLDGAAAQALTSEIDERKSKLKGETDPDRQADLEAQIKFLTELLKELKENDDTGEEALDDPQNDPEWVQEIVGVDRADLRYRDAYDRAKEWLGPPAGEPLGPAHDWLQEMSRLEHTVAILAPVLTAETAYRMARENGAEYASIFPASRWLPRKDAYLSLEVDRLGVEWWRVAGGDVAMEVQAVECATCASCASCGVCEQCWLVSWQRGASEEGLYRICQLQGRRWLLHDPLLDDKACIQQHEEFHVVTWGPEGVEVRYHNEYNPRWLELINTNGTWPQNTMFVRNLDGVTQIARYKWDREEEEWVMPEEDDFVALPPVTPEVDGVRVTVTMDPVIQLPGRATIRTIEPPYVEFQDVDGQPWGRAYLGETTRFWAVINDVEVWVEGDDFRVMRQGETLHGRGTDGEWRAHFNRGEEYWWQHRLAQDENDHWLYEYMEFGARLEPERNMARLMAHGDVEGDEFPPGDFTTPRNLPGWAYEADLNPDGWLDPRTGSLVRAAPPGEFGNTYNFYQVRPCWDSFDTKGGREEPDGQWWLDLDGDGEVDGGEILECPTCKGKGYVLVQPSDVFNRQGQADRERPHRKTIQLDDYQEANFRAEHMPLVLTDGFFKFGFTAGVWHRRESHFPRGEDDAPLTPGAAPERPVEYMLHDPEPGFKGLMRGAGGTTARQRGERLRPAWGYFAVAAARARLNQPDAEGNAAGLRQGAYFDDPAAREDWLSENPGNLYLREDASGRSYWDARLIGLDRQVLDEDVTLGQAGAAETGVGWLLKRIAHGAPGGLIRSGLVRSGETGWAGDVYGSYSASYPPTWVRRDLTTLLRARQSTPGMGAPYIDEYGMLRDPLVDYLAGRALGGGPAYGQLDYNRLDEESVVH